MSAIHVTRRLCTDLVPILRSRSSDNLTAIEYEGFKKIAGLLDSESERCGRGGVTISLDAYSWKAEHLRLLRDMLLAILKTSTNVQIRRAVVTRAQAIADYLGISAVEQLGDITNAESAQLRIA
jgi:hypothetical protein